MSSDDESPPFSGYMSPIAPETYRSYENPDPSSYSLPEPVQADPPPPPEAQPQPAPPTPEVPKPEAVVPETSTLPLNLFDLFKPTNAAPDLKRRREYNDEFQKIMKMPSNKAKFLALRALVQDFEYAAETYGRIIITEHCLPLASRTWKPTAIGGIAGGEKYIVNGILFKFAVDNPDYLLYAGDENAMKSAAHELNGLMHIQGCGIEGLALPLMCYIDFRGFRLVAVSLLPINSTTLVYGSADAGATVHADVPELNSKMAKLGQILNLKEHQVSDKQIYGPADIEGHQGLDGLFYLLDFARLCPPEPPTIIETTHGKRGTQLYRLLRPEFVRRYSKPLCSDAFTAMATIGFREHSNEVKEAFQYLVSTVIPATTVKFLSMEGWQDTTLVIQTNFVASALHRAGINLRHLGRVRSHLLEITRVDPHDQAPAISTHLLHEAAARVAKNQLRTLLREKMKTTGFPANDPYRHLTVEFLKTLLGDSQQSFRYWNRVFRHKLVADFPQILAENEARLDDIRGAISPRTLVRRLSVLMDLDLDIQDNFTGADVKYIGAKVTRLPYAEYAEAMVLYYEGKEQRLSGQQAAASRLWKLSKKLLQQCLHTRYDFTYVVSLAKVERKLFESGELSMTVEEFEKYLLELYAEIAENVSPLMKVSEKVQASKNSFVDAVMQLQRERVRICVQCHQEFKDSLNVEGCCSHHRTPAIAGIYPCCGLQNGERGCTQHQHRIKHHNEWPYAAGMERIQAIVGYTDTRSEFSTCEDLDLETGSSFSISFGRLTRWRTRASLIEQPTFYLHAGSFLEIYSVQDLADISNLNSEGTVLALKRDESKVSYRASWLCKGGRVVGIRTFVKAATSTKGTEAVAHFSIDPPELRHLEFLSHGGLDEKRPASAYVLPADKIVSTTLPVAPRRRRDDFPCVGLHDLLLKVRTFEPSSSPNGNNQFKFEVSVINRSKEESILVDSFKVLWRNIGEEYRPCDVLRCDSPTLKIEAYSVQNVTLTATVKERGPTSNWWNQSWLARTKALRLKLVAETIEGQESSVVVDWVNPDPNNEATIPVCSLEDFEAKGIIVKKENSTYTITGWNNSLPLDTTFARRVVYQALKDKVSEVPITSEWFSALDSSLKNLKIWGLVDLNTNLLYAWKIAYLSPTAGGVVYRPVEPYCTTEETVENRPADESALPDQLLSGIQLPPQVTYLADDDYDDKQALQTFGRVSAHPLIATLDQNMQRLNQGLELILSKLGSTN